MQVTYPARDVSVSGIYMLRDDSFDTELTVQWLKTEPKNDDEDTAEGAEIMPKAIQGKFQWRDFEGLHSNKDNQSISFGLTHPSFDKDVTLYASYYRDKFKTAIIQIDYDYKEDEDHHASFKSEINNLSENVGYKNYSISIAAQHMASELNLNFDGSLGLKPNFYKIDAIGNYKRGYLPEMELELTGFIDSVSKEIKFYVSFSKLHLIYRWKFIFLF